MTPPREGVAPARETVLRVLHGVRPEANLDALPPAADLREELDLDSFDFLNVIVALHEASGVDVPESDYAAVRTLDAMVGYLATHAPAERES